MMRNGSLTLNDVLSLRIPTHGPLLAIAFHRHPARNGNSEAKFERAIRFFAAANAIQEVLHMSARRRGRSAKQRFPLRNIHLFRRETNLSAFEDCPICP